MNTPRVTTVIPTFRRPQLLRRAIASVLEQEAGPVKICVYDNNSGDETAQVVNEMASQHDGIYYYCHPENIGGIANFKYGMSQVDTEFFSLLSDDDYLLPGFYARAVAALDTHADAMFWTGATINVDDNGVIWDARGLRWLHEGMVSPPDGVLYMLGGMAPAWTSMLFRREVIVQAGSIDERAGGPSDLEYCLRVAARYPYIFEKYPAAVFSFHAQSFSASQPLEAFWPGWRYMLGKFEAEYGGSPGMTPAIQQLRRDARKMLLRRGANALASSRYDFAYGAAAALEKDLEERTRAWMLRFIATVCENNTVGERIYRSGYRFVEQQMIASRDELLAPLTPLLRE